MTVVSLLALDHDHRAPLGMYWSDIKDLITLDEVMDELQLGPNGGLLYCMELCSFFVVCVCVCIGRGLIGVGLLFPSRYLLENMDAFKEELGDFTDDYLIIDCPGTL